MHRDMPHQKHKQQRAQQMPPKRHQHPPAARQRPSLDQELYAADCRAKAALPARRSNPQRPNLKRSFYAASCKPRTTNPAPRGDGSRENGSGGNGKDAGSDSSNRTAHAHATLTIEPAAPKPWPRVLRCLPQSQRNKHTRDIRYPAHRSNAPRGHGTGRNGNTSNPAKPKAWPNVLRCRLQGEGSTPCPATKPAAPKPWPRVLRCLPQGPHEKSGPDPCCSAHRSNAPRDHGSRENGSGRNGKDEGIDGTNRTAHAHATLTIEPAAPKPWPRVLRCLPQGPRDKPGPDPCCSAHRSNAPRGDGSRENGSGGNGKDEGRDGTNRTAHAHAHAPSRPDPRPNLGRRFYAASCKPRTTNPPRIYAAPRIARPIGAVQHPGAGMPPPPQPNPERPNLGRQLYAAACMAGATTSARRPSPQTPNLRRHPYAASCKVDAIAPLYAAPCNRVPASRTYQG